MSELRAGEVLTVIAEIAIALAGFTGIVVAFRQRGIASWAPHELVRLRFMLGIACATLFFALFPFLPHYMGLATAQTWSVSSAVMGIGFLAVVVVTHVGTQGHREQLSRGWFITYHVGTSAVACLAIADFVGLFGGPLPGIYLVGLGWLLFFSTTLFVRLVLAPVHFDG